MIFLLIALLLLKIVIGYYLFTWGIAFMCFIKYLKE